MDIVFVILELLKIIVPTLIVAVAMYYLTTSYINRDYRHKLLELRMSNAKTTLPARLQAYERIVLFLERITPSNMLIRISGASMSAQEYHRLLLTEIRHEFDHNITQQMYMSDQAWDTVKRAREDVVTLINRSFQQMNEKSRGTELAKKVLETIIAEENDPTSNALLMVRRDVQQLF
ncbi:MAG: hypothetical protein EOO03_13425 [Chitinophagaceae bacterium]|nr:MAG: hypothetical protein EOO03_13425 [Chitinophagaceae bacterium]